MKHEPMRPRGLKHPSGQPIFRKQFGVISRTRVPCDEPLTPGLRRDRQTYAVGFTAKIESDWSDDEYGD